MGRPVSIVTFALGFLTLAIGALHAEDWPMYGRNLRHTFSNERSSINPSNVSSLQAAWTFTAGDVVSASPAVVDGVVYVGSWDGYFYAFDAHSGLLKWKFQVDCQNAAEVLPWPSQCVPAGTTPPSRLSSDGGLITSSAAVIDHKVYFAGGKTLYSLNAKDGSLRWKLVICGNPDDPNCATDTDDPTRIFSSPALFGGLVFVGHTVDGDSGYRGGFEAIDAATGKLRWRFETDPGGGNRGCGNVWSSAAIDERLGLVYFGTGDCHEAAPAPYHEAVIALEARTGQPKWVFRRPADPSDMNHCDFDFGASPNIIDLVNGRFLGIGGKDGTYYLINRLTGALDWQRNVVFGGFLGGFYGGAAFDGSHIFSATGIGDLQPLEPLRRCTLDPRDSAIQEPSMHALNALDGRLLWQQPQNHSFGATTLADDVVFSGVVGIFGSVLNAYDARDGRLLAALPMPGAVNSAAIPAGKMLFVTSGNSFDGLGGVVRAFTLPP